MLTQRDSVCYDHHDATKGEGGCQGPVASSYPGGGSVSYSELDVCSLARKPGSVFAKQLHRFTPPRYLSGPTNAYNQDGFARRTPICFVEWERRSMYGTVTLLRVTTGWINRKRFAWGGSVSEQTRTEEVDMAQNALNCARCPKKVLGRAVILIESEGVEPGEQDWSFATGTLQSQFTERQLHFAIVHPICFDRIVSDTYQREGIWMAEVGVGHIADIREALEI